MFDVTWCGGLTEARKIATMADAYELPSCPHTAGGPLLFYASTHLSTAAQRVDPGELPALLRTRLAGDAGESHCAAGWIHPGSRGKPGFGMQIKPEAWNHPAAIRQVSGR